MTLPAHRFRDREERKPSVVREGGFQGSADPGRPTHLMQAQTRTIEERKATDGGKVWVCDYDETITTAPKVIAHVATALKAMGDKFYVLTGNDSPREELLQQLNDYGIPFDDLIQYHDSQSDGIARAHYLDQLGAWCAIDNRIDRAGTYVQVCPHLFVMAEPPKVAEQNAHGSKKKAKKAAKELNRSEERSAAPPPPNYRPMDEAGQCCGDCEMYDATQGICWGYGNTPVETDHVCDSWSPETDTP